ncbi:Cna B-type domain-containing protein [Bacillus cereus]
MQFNSDETAFDVEIDKAKASGNTVTIGYKANITEGGKKQEFLKNEYTIKYQVKDEEQVSDSDGAKVENIISGGGAGGNKTTSITGTKKWNDNNATDRPTTIKVDLLQNNKVVDTKEVTAEKDWKYEFKELAVFDKNGAAYEYKVKEQPVPGYESKVEGYDITNTKVVQTTNVSGTKKWEDYNNKFNTRPGSITVKLLQNGTEFQTKEVKADKDGNWSFDFKDLPKYDEKGNEIKYTVSEVKVDGYETKVEGTTITNTYKNTDKTEVSGKKVWEDYNNKFNTRPESIKVQLLQGDKVVQDKTVKADEKGNWNFSFKDLPKYDEKGNEIKYTVSEVKVDGYETKVEGTTITNTYKNTDKTEVSGKKVWEDYNNKFNTRPESIKVQLLQGDKVVQDKTVKADEKGNWNFSFKDLPKYDEKGNEIKYTVSEVKVDGYETKVDGTTITNTYKNTDKTEVSGKKVWEDYNNKFNTRPESITVQLLQGDKVVQDKTVKADEKGNWNFSFKDLPKYDEKGNEIKYTVSEVKVDGYETKVDGTTITNTYKNTDKTEVNGKKVWEDYNNKFNTRPGSITVKLLQNGTEFQTKEVKADKDGNWSFDFKDLPKYDGEGNEIQYTVNEVKVDGYETKVDGTTITNTYKNTDKTEVSGKKVWEDYNNKFNTRSESITVQLLQGDKVVQDKTVKADEKGNWNFSFKDLPKYDEKGNEIKYTVSEVKVDGYETKVEGTTITNTYKNTDKTEVSGKKVWDDNNAIDRPLSIKVDLLQNGKVIDTKEVSVATNWKYTFEKLRVYDANGVAYKYEVKEQPVAGYKSEVNGYDITNTKIKDDPKDPSTDPKDPNTNTNNNSDSKVPPTTENDKQTLLPNTGGTSAEMSSILGGMVLFLLGGILLTRQRIK